MIKSYFTDRNGARWNRITKQAAFKALAAGLEIGACACNLNPGGFWGFMDKETKDSIIAGFTSYSSGADNDLKACFDRYCDNFKWYNCRDNETGRYIAFYLQEAVING